MTEDPFRRLAPPRRPLPPDGLSRALRDGRRRRRTAASASVAGVSVVAAAAALAGGDGAPSRLTTSEPTASSRAGSRSASALPTATPPVPLPSVSLPPDPLASPTPGATPPATESPAPKPSPERGPWVGLGPRDPDGGPELRRTSFQDFTYCEQGGQVAPYRGPSGLCAHLAAPATIETGAPAELAFTMCLAAGSNALELEFPTRHEVFLHAYDPEAPEPSAWRWDEGFRFPEAPHTLRMSPGDCYRWTTTWAGQDVAGYAVAPDEYELVAVSTATQLWGEDMDFPGPPGTAWVEVVRD